MESPAVDDSQALEELLLPIVEKLEKKEFDLPPLPQVASQVLALTTDPDGNADQLANLIQEDPVLTSKVFQTSNSAAFGANRRIESLQQAIAWLGLHHVAGTAFTLSVKEGAFNVRGYERQVKGLWTHAIGTGYYAKAIAGQIGQSPDSAFLCGLLHAIGKPFIVHTVNQCRKDSAPPLPWTAMLTVMKESYIEVGRQLAEAWEFPDTVKEAINLHEDHAYHLAVSPGKGAIITCLARQFASHLVDPEAIQEDTLRALPVVQCLKLTDEDMTPLFAMQDTIKAHVENMLI